MPINITKADVKDVFDVTKNIVSEACPKPLSFTGERYIPIVVTITQEKKEGRK